MRVFLASDHAGFELKQRLIDHLTGEGHEPIDCGPYSYDAEDDYPPYVLAAAAATVAEEGSFGVVIGGSGNGEAIAANKVPGVRAALAWTQETARLGRLHNDANVISLGARMVSEDEAIGFVDTFLGTAFTGEERHVRRITMLTAYEQTGELPTIG
ncbi:MAG: ribose 5-phosphate isomerase [Frankiales bacterium]|jgi:ribose 5-phosphate isomerase B|nr:ribose 5-phosphate isomerase [Frankiales bacterium]